MATISVTSEAAIKGALSTYYTRLQIGLQRVLPAAADSMPPADLSVMFASPMGAALVEIAQVAEGTLEPDGAEKQALLRSIVDITVLLWNVEEPYASAVLADPLGRILFDAWLRLTGDQLVTYAEAAELAGKRSETLAQMVTRGGLIRIVTPGEAFESRLLRSQVLALKERSATSRRGRKESK